MRNEKYLLASIFFILHTYVKLISFVVERDSVLQDIHLVQYTNSKFYTLRFARKQLDKTPKHLTDTIYNYIKFTLKYI